MGVSVASNKYKIGVATDQSRQRRLELHVLYRAPMPACPSQTSVTQKEDAQVEDPARCHRRPMLSPACTRKRDLLSDNGYMTVWFRRTSIDVVCKGLAD